MHEAWISLGVGIRFAQDIGAHRQFKINTVSDRIDAEQWKRCFWSVPQPRSRLTFLPEQPGAL